MSEKKKQTKPKLFTKSEIVEYAGIVGDGDQLLFVDNKPALSGERYGSVAQVAYVAHPDNTMSVWMHRVAPEAPPDDWAPWSREVERIRPSRGAALVHWESLKWQLFRKSDHARRRLAAKDEARAPVDRERLRHVVRYYYDLQKLRIQFGNRDTDQHTPAVLGDDDKTFLGRQSVGLEALEKSALAEINFLLKGIPIWEQWLKHQKGIGPTIGGAIVAEIDITRSETVSQLWAYCGLHVDNKTGRSVKRERGKKSNWNPFLKAKLLFVMGGCLLKSNSDPWRSFYDNYKHRKQSERVKDCMLCKGKGALKKEGKIEVPATPDQDGATTCYNCDGKCHNVMWGRSDAHRHEASNRYMVKMFAMELWKQWRTLEGLPVGESYAEAKLGIRHGDHAATPPKKT